MFIDDHALRIISHPLCPFAQQLRIVLLRKGYEPPVDFEVQHVDLAELPSWFRRMSPQGRMPVLTVDGEVATFETRNACELLDEITPGRLHPADPVDRLLHRDAMLVAEAALDALKGVFTAKEIAPMHDAIGRFFAAMTTIEPQLAEGAPTYGERFSLVDAAFAPAFSLALFHPRLAQDPGWAMVPRTRAWANALLEDESVRRSRCESYHQQFKKFFALFGSAFDNHTQEVRHAG